MTEKKKIGRPKEINPKNRKVTIRMTEQEFLDLERISKEQGLNKSEVILKSLQLLDTEK